MPGVALYCDDTSMLSFCKRIIKDAGLYVSVSLNAEERARADLIIVGFSFLGEPLDWMARLHPFNRVLLFSRQEEVWGHATVVTDIVQVSERLKQLVETVDLGIADIVTTKQIRRKSSRKVRKTKCPHCQNDIGATTLGLGKHLAACYAYKNKKVAWGDMVTLRQPSGRSRGSLLTVYIPDRTTVCDQLFLPGLHFVSSGPLIKAINAHMNATYRYDLTVKDPKQDNESDLHSIQ